MKDSTNDRGHNYFSLGDIPQKTKAKTMKDSTTDKDHERFNKRQTPQI